MRDWSQALLRPHLIFVLGPFACPGGFRGAKPVFLGTSQKASPLPDIVLLCLPQQFPLPLPLDGCFQCSGPSLSKKRLLAVAKRRLLHILVYSLNVLYLGRFPTAEEVGRRPTVWHLKCYQRLRALIAVCGDDAGRFPVPPGRSGPELVAHLFQLEKFS